MRRRRRAPESSLELLLDTICNTFGGVLFLAILIAMLLQMRSRATAITPPIAADQRRLQEMHTRQAEANAQLESLRRTVREQQSLMAQFLKPEDVGLVEDMEHLKQQRSGLVAARSAAREDMAKAQIDINRTAQELTGLEASLQDLRTKEKALEQSLQQETQSRTQAAKLPTLHDTSRHEEGFCLRDGRIYQVHKGGRLNEDDFDLKRAPGRVGISPKTNAGRRIGSGEAAKSVLEDEISGLDPSQSYVAVFVWPDSYGEFRQMKAIIVKRGFEYRLVPLTNNTDALWQGGGQAKVLR